MVKRTYSENPKWLTDLKTSKIYSITGIKNLWVNRSAAKVENGKITSRKKKKKARLEGK